MKNDFIIHFNKKYIILSTLLIFLILPIVIYFTVIFIPNILNNDYDLKQISICFFGISTTSYGILYLLYTYIYLFIKVLFKKEKEAIIINDKGIYRSKWYIFSKPIFISWNDIDMYTYEYEKLSPGDTVSIWQAFTNNSICLTLKKEFYDSLSVMEKIACALTSLTSKGHNFRIKLSFTKRNAVEVVNKIKEYSPKNNI